MPHQHILTTTYNIATNSLTYLKLVHNVVTLLKSLLKTLLKGNMDTNLVSNASILLQEKKKKTDTNQGIH